MLGEANPRSNFFESTLTRFAAAALCVLSVACSRGTNIQMEGIPASAMSPKETAAFLRTERVLESECPSLKGPDGKGMHRSVIRHVLEAQQLYGIDHELILAVIANESRCRPDAKSSAGALGLMQLSPDTARHMNVSDPGKVRDNILAGSKYLSALLGAFSNNLTFALAAYNAGPATVKRFGGLPPYSETQAFVVRVLKSYRRFSLVPGRDLGALRTGKPTARMRLGKTGEEAPWEGLAPKSPIFAGPTSVGPSGATAISKPRAETTTAAPVAPRSVVLPPALGLVPASEKGVTRR